jgi:hypothetical protein
VIVKEHKNIILGKEVYKAQLVVADIANIQEHMPIGVFT